MTVIIPKKAYLTIIASCVRFANQTFPFDDWLESYGIFVGKNKGDDVIISEAYPITHQKKRPEDVIDTVYWSNEDYESFAMIDDNAFSRGEFTIGWYHSHPGFKLMMSHLDLQTTFSYQQFNPLAISLVFNPTRLTKQVEPPDRRGDPEIKLENDPGFLIFRLDDVNMGPSSTYHEVDFKIEGFDNLYQAMKYGQDYVKEVALLFPREKVFNAYNKFIDERLSQLNSMISGTEDYLKTLTFKGEANRVPEVLQNQTKDINKYVAETFMKIENVRDFLDFLEYKERGKVVPKIKDILMRFDEAIIILQEKIKELSKKF